MTDIELVELAAKAAGIKYDPKSAKPHPVSGVWFGLWLELDREPSEYDRRRWNPLTDDGDRYRLAKQLGISIDFQDCCSWKRLANGELIQEFWGGDCGDEAHAVVRAAAEVGRAM